MPLGQEVIHTIHETARLHAEYKLKYVAGFEITTITKSSEIILKAYQQSANQIKNQKRVSASAEWLLDNYYLIEEQIKDIQQTGTKDFDNKLPVINSENNHIVPRIYRVAEALIDVSHFCITEADIIEYLNEYQSVTYLQNNELWCTMLMIRICLIRRAAKIAEAIIDDQESCRVAQDWAKQLCCVSDDTQALQKQTQLHNKSIKHITPAYVHYFIRELKESDNGANVLSWVEGQVAVQNTTTDALLNEYYEQQRDQQIEIGEVIGAFRMLSKMRWDDLFEEISLLHHKLKEDPHGTYENMVPESKRYYRKQVESIARQTKINELYVANKVIECAQDACRCEKPVAYKTHIGYFLLDEGKKELCRKLGVKFKPERKKLFNKIYLPSIVIVTILLSVLIAMIGKDKVNVCFFVSLIIPISCIVIQLLNKFVTANVKPTHIPKLEFEKAIPEEYKTMVVIPALIVSKEAANELFVQMEVNCLANLKSNVVYSILGDFKDGTEALSDTDKELLEYCKERTKKLNEQFGEEAPFYFFHRKRTFSEVDQVWMGWERKRGALIEFNHYLRTGKGDCFAALEGAYEKLEKIRFVMTLDADTKLPRDSVAKMIGAIAHVLNTPSINEEGKQHGYGLLQPAIGVSIDTANKTVFSQTYSGQTGIDPYTTAISDVYQDLFDEGTFTGKGIYDLCVFDEATANTFPNNLILSHDLIEGSYAKAGLVTDVEFIDGYPSGYLSYSKRLHRWTRGDWQITGWLKKKVKNRNGETVENNISSIAKWKIIDNARRSLIMPALMELYIYGTFFAKSPIWLIIFVITLILPTIINLIHLFVINGTQQRQSFRTRQVFEQTKIFFQELLFMFAFLPHQAFLSLDAILRSSYRKHVSHKKMLEWITAADSERFKKNSVGKHITKMWISIATALLLVFSKFVFRIPFHFIDFIAVSLWVLAPWIAWHSSKPVDDCKYTATEDELKMLRRIQTKTWNFFEMACKRSDHYLPPDNYQEDPFRGIAHRTSPTNIGLYLLVIISAYDLGYIPITGVIKRLERTIKSIERLETWNGHLYNWYDTLTLKTLEPRYVSAVDSGNFACYLLTLSTALKKLETDPIITKEQLQGIMASDIEGTKRHLMQYIVNSDEPLKWMHIGAVLCELDKQKSSAQKQIREHCQAFQTLFPFAKLVMDDGKEFEGESFKQLHELLKETNTIYKYKNGYGQIISAIAQCMKDIKKLDKNKEQKAAQYLNKLEESVVEGYMNAGKLRNKCRDLANKVEKMVYDTDFETIYDKKTDLFPIGIDISEGKPSSSHYDLLATEARQASFLAIAKGDIPQRHWFRLGRPLTRISDTRGLLSWSGTMFEYFMPCLLMKTYEKTLLSETYQAVINAQRRYGDKKHMPWGVSESAFYSFDFNLDYKYKAFGVPDLGFKRGLNEDAVITPYATALALTHAPEHALNNMRVLTQTGLEGKYGLYEAADYSPMRLTAKRKKQIVKSYMAHHQGMIFVGINNYVNNNIMQQRFHDVPIIKATELLLQERMPSKEVFIKDYQYEPEIDTSDSKVTECKVIQTYPYNTKYPKGHVLSNGKYQVFINNRGGGYSSIHNIQINRWESDAADDQYGIFFYLKDLESNEIWSATYRPTNKIPDKYKVDFSAGIANFVRVDNQVETTMDVAVSPRDQLEVRRISVRNMSDEVKSIDITAYLEPIMAQFQDERAHPAFMNLFIETDYLADKQIMMVSRRAGAKEYPYSRLGVQFISEESETNNFAYETQRAQFIGRNQVIAQPEGITQSEKLTNQTGTVTDACIAMRHRITIEPQQKVRFKLLVIPGRNEEEIVETAEAYQTQESINKLFELARAHNRVELDQLGITRCEGITYQSLLSKVMYRDKQPKQILSTLPRETIWRFGISGDMPIALVLLDKENQIDNATQMAKAHQYWRLKGVQSDLVIVEKLRRNGKDSDFGRLNDMIRMYCPPDLMNHHGGVYIFGNTEINDNELLLLKQIAALVIDLNIIESLEEWEGETDEIVDCTKIDYASIYDGGIEQKRLSLYNGLGGFACSGREYQLYLGKEQSTPMPWSNIVGTEQIGFIATEAGGGYTWFNNSRQYKITPWRNDPVSDLPGEVVYLRDMEDNSLWTIPKMPCGHNKETAVTHGWGYTIYETECNGLNQKQKVYLQNNAMKVTEIELKNTSKDEKKIELTGYVEWILGVNKQCSNHITLKYSQQVWHAKNHYLNNDQPMCFYACSQPVKRTAFEKKVFFGLQGSLIQPLYEWECEGTEELVHGDCSVVQTEVSIKPNETKHVYFWLGTIQEDECINKQNMLSNIKSVLETQKAAWRERLQRITVSTPDTAFNTLMNGWLMYQSLSSRVNGKTGYYQAGGAYGYRDQLQDMLTIIYSDPTKVKEHILNSCAHQFEEGDVQHWWHPPASGVRTQITDDRLFLPYIVTEYIRITGDTSILKEETPFLVERQLEEGEHDIYSQPASSENTASVLEHCIRAINCSLTAGQHGIPLMGGGDWNDGMDKVGENGGESIWLGWFTVFVIDCFAPICEQNNRQDEANKYRAYQKDLLEALDEHGWDGQWYRRAFYGDGTPLGSHINKECQIDLIAQSWAAICGKGNSKHAQMALKSACDYLVKKHDGIICLLTPAFNKTDKDPGYIKGYIPGVRENGGQYTHAAIWLVLGLLCQDLNDEAWEMYSMINPINHTRTKLEINTYKVEPYVIAADVYNNEQHKGRGGWTWYTGSASWMYKVGLEYILGVGIYGDTLALDPKIPSHWNEVKITVHKGNTPYHIVYKKTNGQMSSAKLDANEVDKTTIPFKDDGKEHIIEIAY